MAVRVYHGQESDAHQTPAEGFLLGWSAVLVLFLCLIGICFLPRRTATVLRRFALLWAATLLCFFGGVHRGASFYNREGPILSEISAMLLLYFTGLLALALPREENSWRLLQAGYLLTLIADVSLAKKKRLPSFFARLRPPQMSAALLVISLLAATKSGAYPQSST